MAVSASFKKGSSEMLILYILSTTKTDMYGYELVKELETKSNGAFVMKSGSLYPVLYRLMQKGAITETQEIVNGRLRKYYHLTTSGKELLENKIMEYRSAHSGIVSVMGKDVVGNH